ncbi:hypothetical protein [Mesonia sp. K7]|uniref:hypothetical protein n=1 Tax=Mesonia sp. K7 TaxID=2218606 RepID=UPI000DAA5962|nr:hypothetical protein [Mesonia sp. K7]PZD79234.1 hypothetical protein DNG35_01745 [Mesonia sp. K7]
MKKISKIGLIGCILVLGTISLNAQVLYYDEKSDVEYEINPNTPKKQLKAFLKSYKATAIEFNSNLSSQFPFRLKLKKGNWVLYDLEEEQVFLEKKTNRYSFELPTVLMEENRFTIAKSKEKTFLVNLDENKIEAKIKFDEVVVQTKKDTLYDYIQTYSENGNFDYKEEESVRKVIDKIAVRSGKKWGLIEVVYGEDMYYLSHDFLYDSIEEVPQTRGFESYQLAMMESIRENYKVDLLIALDEFGYYFKGRNKQTKLWGVFMGEAEVLESIPTKYDSITRHRHPLGYEVWKDGKVGYYNGNSEMVFDTNFDDYKRVHLDYTYGSAFKRQGKWELYDTYQPEKLVDGSADTIEELIELWLAR